MTVFQKQCVLAYLGYYEGQIDGQWGPLTKAATEAFQADYGLHVDGVYGDGTHAKAVEIIASKELSAIQQKREAAGLAPSGPQPAPEDKPISIPGGDWPDCPNFTREEFACKCGCGFDNVSHKLVQICQTVRDHFGAAFIISSGCRCKTYNARVGGVYDSRHLLGHAVDFRIRGRRAAEVDAFVATLPGIVYHYCIDADYVHMDIGGVIAMEWLPQAASWVGSGLTILSGVSVLAGLIVAGSKIWDGIKCILRSEMLHIYYEYKDTGKIRQYELENFVMMYKAYKAMHGNSFIEKIHREVVSWEVIT